ncbi:MAG TPA: hypothetical protein VK918_03235 [Pyrinomonadaceae bacterium]|nr:hypothetical protein [Pyrinomonadaceae bacterium]
MSFKSNRPVLLGSRRQFLLLIFLLAIGGSAQAQNGEEYRVYEAVLGHMFKGGVTRFDMNAKVDKIVIRDRTHSEYAAHETKENWEQVKLRMKLVTDEVIASYESVRKQERAITRNFDIPFDYLLISDKQLEEIFFDRSYDRSRDYWTEFYKIYPKSAGYNSFSRVAFDKPRRTALVYFVNWCGPLCGTGTYLVVEKEDESWSVKESAQMWIS